MPAVVRHRHLHRHGEFEHTHEHEHPAGQLHDDPAAHDHDHPHDDHHGHHHREGGHGHSHGLIDRSIVRSARGVKAVSLSLGVLGVAALAQTVIFLASGSVALLADLIHNFGDALTAIPLGVAFLLHSFRGEDLAGRAVVAVIFFSACVALYETTTMSPRCSDTKLRPRRPTKLITRSRDAHARRAPIETRQMR
jgi:hypothetical protein